MKPPSASVTTPPTTPPTTPLTTALTTPLSLRRELVAAGWTDRGLAQALRDGSLVRPRRGAYVDGDVWLAMRAHERYVLTVRAALRQATTGVLASHDSAAALHGAPLWGSAFDVVHVTRYDGRAGRKERGIRQHCGALRDEDRAQVHGLAVTSATRTALDLTTTASTTTSIVAVNDLLHRGLTTLEALRERYQDMTGWPGTLRTDLVLRRADGRCESVGESLLHCFCFEWGLPAPVLQHEVRDADGRVVARLDMAWPELGIWIEFDGRIKYDGSLEQGGSVVDVVLKEKAREDLVRELTGWRCVRVTWGELMQPERLAVRLSRVFGRSFVRLPRP